MQSQAFLTWKRRGSAEKQGNGCVDELVCPGAAGFEEGERGPEPSKVGILSQLEKMSKWIPAWSF